MNTILKYLKMIGQFILDILLKVVLAIRDLGIAIWHGLVGIKNFFVRFGKRFAKGSLWTKISHFVMGAGNFARKQFVKGAIFLTLEVVFIAFMVASPTFRDVPLGAKGIENFFTLGEYHGMQIDPNYNFNSEYVAVNTAFDIHNPNNDKIENTAYRFKNLFAAMEANEVSIRENDEKLVDANKDPYYMSSEFESIIVDKRSERSTDTYGYTTTTVGKLDGDFIRVYQNDFIWITSKTPLNFPVDLPTTNTEQTIKDLEKRSPLILETKDDEGEEPTKIQLEIYAAKSNSSENATEYRYVVFNNTNNPVQKLTFNSNILDDSVQIEIITFHEDLVNLAMDNSYLMMLFGIVTFMIIAIFLIIYNVAIASSVKADQDVAEGKKPTTFIEDLKTLLDSRFHITLLGPALIFLVVFTIIPTLLMILISFTDLASQPGINGKALINWTGFANFIDLFSGTSSGGSQIANEVGNHFGSVITWTLEWALIATFSCYFGGIFLALLINKKDVKGKKVWRTIFILTIAIPQFISLLIMKNLLNERGPINEMLISLGIIDKSNRIDFLQQSVGGFVSDMGDVWLARASVLLINLYIGIPYTMLMTSGILMNIPKDLYEAATIDGANKWQMFRKITLPYVIFVTTPYLISSFIGNMTSFNTIFLTTGGGPLMPGSLKAGHTDLLVTWLFKLTMEDTQYNAGSIIGILTFLITAFMTLICYRNSKAYKEEDTFQ